MVLRGHIARSHSCHTSRVGRGEQPENKKPWRPKGVQGRNVLEQTDSPLALFFVVAIRRAGSSPKSIHVNFTISPLDSIGNRNHRPAGASAYIPPLPVAATGSPMVGSSNLEEHNEKAVFRIARHAGCCQPVRANRPTGEN